MSIYVYCSYGNTEAYMGALEPAVCKGATLSVRAKKCNYNIISASIIFTQTDHILSP